MKIKFIAPSNNPEEGVAATTKEEEEEGKDKRKIKEIATIKKPKGSKARIKTAKLKQASSAPVYVSDCIKNK